VIPISQAFKFRLQYYPIICDVPSTAVFCSEYIERFPGMDSKFFLKTFVTVPVAPIITGITTHFTFRTWRISTYKSLYYYTQTFKKRSVSAILFSKNGEVIGMKVKKAKLN